MYTEKNGRVWSSEESYLKYKLNVRKNLKSSLALENYADHEGKNEIYKEDAFILLKKYRENKQNMNEQQLLQTTSLIVEKFDLIFDKIGREKFVFYDDGDVNYIYENN